MGLVRRAAPFAGLGDTTLHAVLDMLDRSPGKSMSDLKNALPKTWGSPTMAPHCADETKYGIVDQVVKHFEAARTRGETVAGQKIRDLVTVNGVRVTVEGPLDGNRYVVDFIALRDAVQPLLAGCGYAGLSLQPCAADATGGQAWVVLRAAADEALQAAAGEAESLLLSIPNMSHPQSPVGGEEENLEIGRGPTPLPTFDFKPKDHVELGEALDIIDLESGSKVTGHGFYFLKNDAVLLDMALQSFALHYLAKEGFQLVSTPDMARNEVLAGTGFVPRGPETQIYSIADSDLSLIATAEITLAGMLAGEIKEAAELPILLCGLSHCFRTEAGAHGRASRGLYRVHQFTKVEMFAFTTPDASAAMHERLKSIECNFFDALGIPYRILDIATGDLGAPAYRKYDLEAWMPGRGDGGPWHHVSRRPGAPDPLDVERVVAILRSSARGVVVAGVVAEGAARDWRCAGTTRRGGSMWASGPVPVRTSSPSSNARCWYSPCRIYCRGCWRF